MSIDDQEATLRAAESVAMMHWVKAVKSCADWHLVREPQFAQVAGRGLIGPWGRVWSAVFEGTSEATWEATQHPTDGAVDCFVDRVLDVASRSGLDA